MIKEILVGAGASGAAFLVLTIFEKSREMRTNHGGGESTTKKKPRDEDSDSGNIKDNSKVDNSLRPKNWK